MQVSSGYAEKALKMLAGTKENDYKNLWKQLEERREYTLKDIWSPQGPVDLYINNLSEPDKNKITWALTTSNPDNLYAAIKIDFDAKTKKPIEIASQSDPQNYVGSIADAKILENTILHKKTKKDSKYYKKLFADRKRTRKCQAFI